MTIYWGRSTRLAGVAIVAAGLLGVSGAAAGAAQTSATSADGISEPTAARPATFDWLNARVDLPWRRATMLDGSTCPGGRIKFTAGEPPNESSGSATKGGCEYYVWVNDTADVTGDGRPDDIVHFQVHPLNHVPVDVGMSYEYLYSYRNGQPQLRDFVTSSDLAANAQWLTLSVDARPGEVAVHQVSDLGTSTVEVDRVFTWTGHELVPDAPLPGHPEADIAP